MTELRRLALAAAAVIPLSLVSAGIASADLGDGPGSPGFTKTSATYAGIGGAGTIHSASVVDHDGNEWTKESAVLAGPMGAAVLHTEEVDLDDDNDDNDWVSDDKPGRPTHSHGKRPVAHTDDSVSTPARRPAKTHAVRETHHDHVAYAESTKTADSTGATSSHVASHAGDNHAVYESSDLSAGPDGAESEGVKAVARPQYTSYENWYTAADEDGAVSHEVEAVADVTDWHDNDNDHHHTHYLR
ncbi:hypothetical protein ACFQ05_42075 [Amycolatopsis umgeniensis]|uniref:Uncharacterized protein n=1 Tax=Amycolatopsis umgeniensis TaxID=336628 RepID=A0A841AYX0_9PSEU|nr:hypothetical protein [Amycolatopsis umgeniensis]MBB5851298.1 hypothetical protein [Amycolatopsis umgeniensis]